MVEIYIQSTKEKIKHISLLFLDTAYLIWWAKPSWVVKPASSDVRNRDGVVRFSMVFDGRTSEDGWLWGQLGATRCETPTTYEVLEKCGLSNIMESKSKITNES